LIAMSSDFTTLNTLKPLKTSQYFFRFLEVYV